MEVLSRCPLRTSSIVWQPRPGQWMFTVVAKATFALAPGDSPLCDEQDSPVEDETHWDDDERRSLHLATDLVPLKKQPEVLVVGHAHTQAGASVTSLVARVSVGEIDKAIEVVGDRHFTLDGALSSPQKFRRMPLRWERAAGGPGTSNPVGVRTTDEARPDGWGRIAVPNLFPAGFALKDRADVVLPACFGPIARTWPGRLLRLHRYASSWDPERWREHPVPADFDLSYFNAAPSDQMLGELRGDERIVLEHLHPEHARLTTRLAPLRPRASVSFGPTVANEMRLLPDTMVIDSDRGVALVTYRGHVGLDHPNRQGWVVVTLEDGGRASMAVSQALTPPPLATPPMPTPPPIATPAMPTPPPIATPAMPTPPPIATPPMPTPPPMPLATPPMPPPPPPARRQSVRPPPLPPPRPPTPTLPEDATALVAVPSAGHAVTHSSAEESTAIAPPPVRAADPSLPSWVHAGAAPVATPRLEGAREAGSAPTGFFSGDDIDPETSPAETERPVAAPSAMSPNERARRALGQTLDAASRPPETAEQTPSAEPAWLASAAQRHESGERPAAATRTALPFRRLDAAQVGGAALGRSMRLQPPKVEEPAPEPVVEPLPPASPPPPPPLVPTPLPAMSAPVAPSFEGPSPMPMSAPEAPAFVPPTFEAPGADRSPFDGLPPRTSTAEQPTFLARGRGAEPDVHRAPVLPPSLVSPSDAPPAPPPMWGAIENEPTPPADAPAAPETTAAAPHPAPTEAAPVIAAQPAVALRTDELSLTETAKVHASVERKPEAKREILEARKLSDGEWIALRQHYDREIQAEAKRGKTKALREYDAAYLGQLEKERGPVTAEEYAQISVAAERGEAREMLAALGLPPAAEMRLHRAWIAKAARDPSLGSALRAAVERLRAE